MSGYQINPLNHRLVKQAAVPREMFHSFVFDEITIFLLEKAVKIFDVLAQLLLFVRLRVQISACKSAVAAAAVRKPGCQLISYHGSFLPHIFQFSPLT